MGRRSPLSLVALAGVVWLILMSCRTGDVVARLQVTPTRVTTRTRTPRPTFTPRPPTLPPTQPPPPTVAPAPVVRLPVPTRPLVARPAATQPPPPTQPPAPPKKETCEGYYYCILKIECTTAPNTRAEGTVYNNDVPQNGVRLRISGDGNGGQPAIEDFVSGVDPSDYKHIDPALKGKYRLALYEGQQNAGNWWVWIIDDNGDRMSPGAFFNSQDGPGCNTAIIDFGHGN